MHPPHLGYRYEMSAGQCQRGPANPAQAAQRRPAPRAVLREGIGMAFRHLQHVAALVLAEEQAGEGGGRRLQPLQLGSEPAGHGHFSQRHQQSAVRHVVAGGDAPGGIQTEESKLDEQEAAAVEAEIKEMVMRRKRESAEVGKHARDRVESVPDRGQAIPDTAGGAIEGMMATANTAAEALARAATKIADKLNEKKG